MDAQNTIVFHRPAGDKICQVQWAAFCAQRTNTGFELLFYVRGREVEQGELTDAEVSIFVDAFELDTLVGSRFEVPSSYDYERDCHVAHIYYYDHKDFYSNILEVLDRENNSFRVHWSGTTDDIEYYDRSQPRNRVVIEAVFELQETCEATYNHPPVQPRHKPDIGKHMDEKDADHDNEQLSLFRDTV